MGAALLGLGAIGSIGGGLFGGKKAKKAAKKQKRIAQQVQKEAGIQAEAASKQFGFEQNMQDVLQARANIQARQDSIAATREARVRRAAIVASAAAQGLDSRTSSVAGAKGSVVSQFGSNVGQFNIFGQAAQELSRLGGLVAEQQKVQLDSQGRVNVLTGQSQVAAAKGQQGIATGELISGIGSNIFQAGTQLGGLSKSISSIF